MNHATVSPAALLALFAGSALSHHALAQSTDPFPAQFQLSSLAAGNGSEGFVLNGIDTNNWSGVSVASAGDVNGDGIDDLIIGAYGADPGGSLYAGESYVVFGAVGVGAGGTVNLSALNGSNGFVLHGIDADDWSGDSVSSAGDVNGDGIDDLIIGAFGIAGFATPTVGECYVVFGGVGVGAGGSIELSSLNGTNGFMLNEIAADDRSGVSVSSLGDVNGDGIDDLVIGAFEADPNGFSNAGESYVVFGAPGLGAGGAINLAGLDGSNGFVLNGIDADDNSGRSVSSAGDVNGDGTNDLIIGAERADPNGISIAGESYVVFGAPGLGASGSIELSSLNGSNGFVLNGIDLNDFSGASVSSAGDVNGDGIDDLIIGAPQADPNGLTSGESYVVFGAVGVGAGGLIELSSLNGTNGFVLNGIAEGDKSGVSVSSLGDVNGDGIDDLVIGAVSADPNGTNRAGESYVVFGAVGLGAGGSIELSSLNGSIGFVLNGIDEFDDSGWSVSSAGDLNSDGIADLVIGALDADANGNANAGETYVVFGRVNGQHWVSPASGAWDSGPSWREGTAPSIGNVTIDTPIGVRVTGPAGAATLNSLNLDATLGRTTLDLQHNSFMRVANPFALPTSAALTGGGIFFAEDSFTNAGLVAMDAMSLIAPTGVTNTPDGTIEPTDGFIDGALSNSGVLDISALTSPSGKASLEVIGPVTNEIGGQILLRQGNAELEAADGITNNSVMNITFANAALLAPMDNTLLGIISISGASTLLITEDVINASVIILTEDSSLVILGSILGNGVSGPGGGGTAGTVYVEGGVVPGPAPVTFTTARFDGDLNLGLSAYTVIEISGTSPGVDLDQVSSAGNLGAGGTLEVQLVNGYTPQPGDSYQVLDFATLTGSFSSIVLDPGLIAAGADTSKILIDGTIFIQAPCIPDLNNDGFLDSGDITTFVALFLAADLAADLNNDGFLDSGDISAFVALFLAGC